MGPWHFEKGSLRARHRIKKTRLSVINPTKFKGQDAVIKVCVAEYSQA